MNDNQDSSQSASAAQATKTRRKPPTASITHLKHWEQRIFKPRYTRGGIGHESPNWAVEIQFGGERRRWSLGTPNAAAAASKAKQIYTFLSRHGWEATEQEFQKKMADKKKDLTVGQYITVVCEVVPTSKSLVGYISALRKITSDVGQIDGGRAKHDYRGGGRAAWAGRVDSIKLRVLTVESIQKWKVAFLKRAGTDESAKRSARTSINSYLRCARSLFSPKITEHLKSIELPNPLPFAGVKFEPKPSSKYCGKFDLAELITKAREELAIAHPEQFKTLLLCGMVGLRRHEVDLLPWTAFNWHDSTIHIAPTKDFAGKTEDSHGAVMVDSELMELFRGFRAKATSEYVIEAPGREPKSVTYSYYRCAEHFNALIDWLRRQGLTSRKPLHELRKMFGSKINEKFGIHAASMALRHSNIAITCSTYVDSRSRVAVGLGHLLAGESEKVTPMTAATNNSLNLESQGANTDCYKR